MKLVANGVPYFVNWLHDYTYTAEGGRVCVCEIYAGATKEDQELVGLGSAVCSRFDNYCKETGRKISLTRAIASLNLEREQRKLFWEAYFSRKNANKEVTNAI